MRRPLLLPFALSLLLGLGACAAGSAAPTSAPTETPVADAVAAPALSGEGNSTGKTQHENEESEDVPMNETKFYITANGHTFTADFADNSSADALRQLLRKGDLTVAMGDYGGFEKVGALGCTLPRNDTHITTVPGDVILYQGTSITIYYGRNTWSFTRLGKIHGVTGEELLSILGKEDVTVTFSLTE